MRGAVSSEDLPANKRQKRNGTKEKAAPEEPEELGTWLPKGDDWEGQVDKVETIERGENQQLLAFVRFKNRKRTKISMELVYKHLPRPMLRFYEEHLKFT